MKKHIPVIVTLFCILSFGLVYALEETVEEPASISYLVGNVDVDITPDNEIEDFEVAELDMSLPLGTIIRTGKDALCEITMLDGSTVKISAGSVFQIESATYDPDTDKKTGKFKLLFGKVRSKVGKFTTKDSSFDVVSGTALAGVRGTSFGVFFDGVNSQVLVFEGQINLESIIGAFEPLVIDEGQMTTVLEDGLPEPILDIPQELLDEWEEELQKFVAEAVEAPAPEVAPEVAEPKPPKPAEKPPKKEGFLAKYLQMNAYVGTVTIDDNVYARWIFTPELSIGKLGMGLYLPAIFAPNVGIFGFNDWENHDEWDFTDFFDGVHDFLIKFYYISWGQWGDPLYFKIGNIDDFYLGHGFIVDNYSNMLYFPEELVTGMQFNIDIDKGGIETMVSHFSRLQLFGGRLYFRPLGRRIPLAFGVSGIHDKPEPASIWPIADDTGDITENEDQLPRILVFGADAELPILSLDVFSMKLYTDAAKLGYMYDEIHPALVQYDKLGGAIYFVDGLGTAVGLMGKIAKVFSYRFEYRYIIDYYEPGMIDYMWENRRLQFQDELLELIIDQTDPSYERSTSAGFLIKGGMVLQKKIEVGLGFESFETTTGTTTTSVQGGNAFVAVSKGLVPKVYGNLSYDRGDNLRDVFSDPFDESTLLQANVFYELAPIVSLSVNYKRTFQYNDATGENDPIDSFSISTIFSF